MNRVTPRLVTVMTAALLAGCVAVPPADEGVWVDLTHELSSDAVFWPTGDRFQLVQQAKGITPGGYFYSAYSFSAAEHGGTHIDAPVHFAQGRQSTEQIPLDRLIGSAVVVDVTEPAAADRNLAISATDITRWESLYGVIEPGTIVLFRTGYSSFWPDAERYLGTAVRGAMGALNLRFPGLAEDAAGLLVERDVASVGIDTASIDPGRSRFFEAHVMLMKANIPACENLANLEALPARGAFVVALPTKIRGGSGGPLRIVARVPR